MTHRVVPRPGLLVSLLAPVVWLLVPACGARKQEAAKPEPPAADTLRTFAHPSDDGQTLNLEWGRSPSEAKDVFYVVEIASEADRQAGRFRRVARMPSLGSLKADVKRFHDYDDERVNLANRELHYLAIQPAIHYPADAGSVRDKRYYLRLAVVRVGKKVEKTIRKAPPPEEPEKKAEEEKPVLLVARERSGEFLAHLEAFHGALEKADAAFRAEKRPILEQKSYRPFLVPIENQIEQTMALHGPYLESLHELDEALRSGTRDPRQELEQWREKQAELERKAREERQKQTPQQEGEEVEVETEVEGEPVYVMAGGAPKVVEAQATLPPLVAPQAARFRAFDLPSDDGETVAVEWPRSPSENATTSYLVEIAPVKDGEPGEFKTAATVPSLGAEKADDPKFFGFARRNAKLHYVGVEPSALFLLPADREGIWQRVVKEEMKLMPPSWAPDDEFPEHVAALAKCVGAYVETVRAMDARLAALAEPLGDGLRALEAPEFLDGLADYAGYATRLKRFESRLAKRNTDAITAKERELNRQPYAFRLGIRRGDETLFVEAEPGEPETARAAARPNLFKGYKRNNLVFSLVFCAIVAAFIHAARRNPNLFIRKIAGLEAVEEAIGRATEMGRSAFFVHGLNGMGSLSTIAAVNILGRVARRAAEYDTRVRVMNRDPIVMAVSQEVVKQSYTEAGRPDAYNDDDVALVASDQFSYVAAVGGRMIREQPAAIFLMGYFYAESLLLAETGASTGAIQIAGTDSYTQIPFFITTCDYTLIGEELFAASAYLSREPKMLGSLRGQDVGKAFLMIVILAFALLATVGQELAAWLPGFRTSIQYLVNTLFQPFGG